MVELLYLFFFTFFFGLVFTYIILNKISLIYENIKVEEKPMEEFLKSEEDKKNKVNLTTNPDNKLHGVTFKELKQTVYK